MEEKIWFAVIQNKADGPHSAADIQQMLNSGTLNFTDFIFKPGLTAWTPISEFKEFERRNTGNEVTELTANLNVPVDQEIAGWILLIKNINSIGQENFIQSGPYSLDQIREKLTRNEVKFDDMIWQRGFKHWTKIGSLDVFDRRRPQNFEKQPKPQTSKEMSSKTVVLEKSIEEGFTEAAATSVNPAVGKTDQPTKHIEAPLPNIKKNKSLPIALSGAIIAMVFAYVGLNAYKQSLIDRFPMLNTFETKLTKPTPHALQRPTKVTPQLKVVSIKSNTPAKPQILFETNLPSGTSISVDFIGEAGRILNYPQLTFRKEVRVISGQMPIIDLSKEDIPPGDYKVLANATGLSSQLDLKVGVHDEVFVKKLDSYRAQLVVQEKRERAELVAASRFLNQENINLQKLLKDKNKRAVVKNVADWRKTFNKKSNAVVTLLKQNPKALIYPQAYNKFVQAQSKLYERASSQRGIASINSLSQADFNKKYQEFQSEIKDLHFQLKK